MSLMGYGENEPGRDIEAASTAASDGYRLLADGTGGNMCPVDAADLGTRLDVLACAAGTDTHSIDMWQCPYCWHNQDWDDDGESGSVAVRDLSGHSQTLLCKKCQQHALVSISIEYTAQRAEG